jgi:hypothetical protein
MTKHKPHRTTRRVYMRKLWNGVLYGSDEGPEILIDWEKRSVTIKRCSRRRAVRLASWMRYKS